MIATRSIVAVVDDDDRMLESLGNLLESAGLGVRLYSAGQALYDEGDLTGIDLLISDVGMPGMSGFDLLRWAREKRPGLPVILITGRPELWGSGACPGERDRYFEKPFDGQRLLAAVRRAIAAGRSSGETPG